MKPFKAIYTIISIIVVIALTGCATPIPPEVIAHANYGAPPPKNYREMIKKEFSHTLIDPTSPLYEFSRPVKGYTRQSPMFNTQQVFGWQVCGTVNAKNRFGGYVGAVPFFVLFKNGVIIEHLVGEIPDNQYGISVLNSAINSACQR
jgi:hypothetical protein